MCILDDLRAALGNIDRPANPRHISAVVNLVQGHIPNTHEWSEELTVTEDPATWSPAESLLRDQTVYIDAEPTGESSWLADLWFDEGLFHAQVWSPGNVEVDSDESLSELLSRTFQTYGS